MLEPGAIRRAPARVGAHSARSAGPRRAGAAPRPDDHQQGFAYYGGLDGLRGLAIAAVLVYHGGVAWAPGGFLGVEAFFVLSGFLITSLLVSEWRRKGSITLRAFWARRARRLLPALFVLVTVVGIHQLLIPGDEIVPGLRGDGIATLLYYGNWHQIATQSNYFAATGPVSPLQHTWSLAIEEQFYIVWPLIFVLTLWLGRRLVQRSQTDRTAGFRMLLGLVVAGGALSVLDTILRFDSGRGINRVYYGTDTRAVSILSGVSLALLVAVLAGRKRPATPGKRPAGPAAAWQARLASGAGLLALAGVLAMMARAHGDSDWLYPYGFLVVDGCVVVLICAVVFFPSSLVGRLFSLRPVRAVGMISYGLYLWHFPLYLWLNAEATGLAGDRLLAMRISATLAVALVSYIVVEQPIRRRRLPAWMVRSLSPVGAGGALAALLVGSAAASAPPVVLPTLPVKANHPRVAQTCTVRLTDTAQYGLAPLSPKQAALLQPKWLAARAPKWSGSRKVTFHTCPPKRVLLIGDSVAFSAGMALMLNEQAYGTEVANASILGCSFGVRGEINVSGVWEQQRPGCADALSQWAREARALRAQVVVVEMGLRDESDWRWGREVVHLGQARFDAYLQSRMDLYVRTLARGGVKVVFLTVPWSHPRDLPDGAPAPAGSASRHRRINAMLRSTVSRFADRARLIDIDRVISPGDRYRARVNGQLCRFDGVHLTIYCGTLLQPLVLDAARAAIGS